MTFLQMQTASQSVRLPVIYFPISLHVCYNGAVAIC